MPSSTTKWIEREMSNRNLFNQMRSFLLFVIYFVGDDNIIQEMNESMLMQSKQCKKSLFASNYKQIYKSVEKFAFPFRFFFLSVCEYVIYMLLFLYTHSFMLVLMSYIQTICWREEHNNNNNKAIVKKKLFTVFVEMGRTKKLLQMTTHMVNNL